jgi:hypothetical protein
VKNDCRRSAHVATLLSTFAPLRHFPGQHSGITHAHSFAVLLALVSSPVVRLVAAFIDNSHDFVAHLDSLCAGSATIT